jgi:hypothetical protein
MAPQGESKTQKRVRERKKEIKMSAYIAKIAKQYTGDAKTKGGKMTVSKSALAEVELLVEDAISMITRNADSILLYSGTHTLGKKTAEAATCVAFSGLLRENARDAGDAAVYNFYSAHQNVGKV